LSYVIDALRGWQAACMTSFRFDRATMGHDLHEEQAQDAWSTPATTPTAGCPGLLGSFLKAVSMCQNA
jgi:hypothetical protein